MRKNAWICIILLKINCLENEEVVVLFFFAILKYKQIFKKKRFLIESLLKYKI